MGYKMTGGYSVDRTVGNTGGLGGVFGLIHAVGGSLPFPEGRPWIPSMKWEVFTHHLPSLFGRGVAELKWFKMMFTVCVYFHQYSQSNLIQYPKDCNRQCNKL